MWHCSQQHENREEAKFCNKCGEKRDTRPRCPACGTSLEPDDIFCTSCGHRSEPPSAQPATASPVPVAAPPPAPVAAAPPMPVVAAPAPPVEPPPTASPASNEPEPVTFSFGGAKIEMKDDPSKPDRLVTPRRKQSKWSSMITTVMSFALIAAVLWIALYLITR